MHTFSGQVICLFLLAMGRIQKGTKDSDHAEAFIQRAWKQSESLMLRVVPDEEFLHNKINNRGVYVDYVATEDIPEDVCSLRPYGWRFDSIELKQVTKVLKIKH